MDRRPPQRTGAALMLIALVACSPPDPPVIAPGTPLDQLPPAGVCNPGDVALANGVPTGDIQVALDLVAATSGTVTICAGHHVIYPLFLWSFNGNVMVTGETSDPADTVLDGDGFGTLLDVNGDGHWIRNLTFTNAGYSAIDVSSALDLQIISSCIFSDNISDGNYIVNLRGANNRIYNSEFSGNSGWYGSLNIGPYRYPGPDRSTMLYNLSFVGNTSEAHSIANVLHATTSSGGLATIEASGLIFENNEGLQNTLTLTGGGRSDTTHVIEVNDLSLIGNTSSSGRAGLTIDAAQFGTLDVSLTNARFIDNVGASSTTAVGAALDLRAPAPPPRSTDRFNVILRDVRFGRNSNDGAYPDDAAVYVDPRYRVRWQNVDFASGAYANSPADLAGCAPRLGLNVRGRTDGFRGDNCP
jgi:hypothetical protein